MPIQTRTEMFMRRYTGTPNGIVPRVIPPIGPVLPPWIPTPTPGDSGPIAPEHIPVVPSTITVFAVGGRPLLHHIALGGRELLRTD